MALKSRGVPLYLITEEGSNKDQDLAGEADYCLTLPQAPSKLRPMVAVIPLQLLAFYLGYLKGYDVDHPGGTLRPDLKLQPTGMAGNKIDPKQWAYW
jgi:glucosamine 6-phosphate synthetase-like amidotransferase/phosphosugar isomerase protein